jgi:hypothetical protein
MKLVATTPYYGSRRKGTSRKIKEILECITVQDTRLRQLYVFTSEAKDFSAYSSWYQIGSKFQEKKTAWSALPAHVECKIKGVRLLFSNPRKKNRSVQQSASVENYFDYSACITRRKILRLLRLQHRRLHLRQLWLVTLGGSTSTRPWVRKLTLKTCDFVDMQATRRSQQRSRARQQLCLRSWLWFYDNNSTTSSSTTPRRPHHTR